MKEGISPQHLRHYVIEPTLKRLAEAKPGINSEAAIRLLLGTAAHESRMGHYLHQVRGPARGIYQIEPATRTDVESRISLRWPDLDAMVQSMRSNSWALDSFELEGNLHYSTAIARCLYLLVPEPLPHEDDIEGLGHYYKKYFNSMMGAAKVSDFVDAVREWEIA